MKPIKIKSIKQEHYKGFVYNLAVKDDESYFANDFCVHNCRSLLIPVFQGESFEVSDKPKLEPAKGFGGNK